MSRQNYYQQRRRRIRRQLDEEQIVAWVKEERKLQPCLGGRKLRERLKERMRRHDIQLGRDRFFDLLRRHGLLIRRRRRAGTTWSRHGWRVYPNLFKEMEPTAAHQAWVSDLTYLRTEQGFVYLSLVTDAYSRKIVGYHVNDNLEAEGCLQALRMALRQLPAGARPMHHSDRGVQYCCGDYTGSLKRHGLEISMTEQNHCYENAMAERVIGILKQEYGLGSRLPSKEAARLAARQAVRLYNQLRPHMALQLKTPTQVHREAA